MQDKYLDAHTQLCVTMPWEAVKSIGLDFHQNLKS